MAGMKKLFTKAALCSPKHFEVVYKINPWMNGQVDKTLAQRQFDSLKNALEKLNVQTKMIDQVQGLPDMVFCCNSGIVYENKVYLAHFRHPERQGERAQYEKWYKMNGYETFGDTEHFFEGGGDATFVSENLLFAGYGFRSQKEVYSKIQKLGNFRTILCELNNDKFYHLDVCFCPLSSKLALWYPDAFTVETRQRMQNELELIAITAKDATNFVCNSVAVGDTILMPGDGKIHDIEPELRKRGFQIVKVDMSEFLKAGGAVQCLILKL